MRWLDQWVALLLRRRQLEGYVKGSSESAGCNHGKVQKIRIGVRCSGLSGFRCRISSGHRKASVCHYRTVPESDFGYGEEEMRWRTVGRNALFSFAIFFLGGATANFTSDEATRSLILNLSVFLSFVVLFLRVAAPIFFTIAYIATKQTGRNSLFESVFLGNTLLSGSNSG